MAPSKEPTALDPFRLPRRSALRDVATAPSTLGALTSGALIVSHKLGRSPVPLDSLPRGLVRVPPAVWLVALGFPTGYLAGVSAEWLRGKLIQKLLTYEGWIYAPKSFKTMAWAVLLKFLKGQPTDTYAYQRFLPKQPLPDLDKTLDLWLQASSHIVSKEEFEQTKDAVERLRKNEGPKLQRHLQQKYGQSVNWLSEYWLTVAYLSSREPLAINSSFALVNKLPDERTRDPLVRASICIESMTQFYEMILNKELAPIQLQDLVPLCMNGYRYIFNSLRLPGENIDSLKRYPGETHIVILRKGHYYRMETYIKDGSKKRLLRAEEIKVQLQKICEDADKRPEALPVAALTTLNRTKWAKLREVLASQNPDTLRTVESAMFLLTLDHEPAGDRHQHAKVSLTGRGGDRWFDKGFHAVIWPSTAFGATVEHSGSDAMVVGTLAEHLMVNGELENGDVKRTAEGPSQSLPQPQVLSWDLSNLEEDIMDAYTKHTTLADKVDVRILNTSYGKGFMKKCKLSPDGYVQMALQLAYHNLYKETPKTYEPSTNRLYALGRTENIHPVSSMSKAWVKSMSDESCTRQSRQDLLRRAVNTQNKARLMATVGRGCDRHLLGLYCASRELQMDVPAVFLDKAWRAPFRLSTSQTPTRTAELGADIDYDWVLGGFGPTSHDGYGVSYVHMGDNKLNIFVTSWHDCDETSSTKFVNALSDALDDMKALFA